MHSSNWPNVESKSYLDASCPLFCYLSSYGAYSYFSPDGVKMWYSYATNTKPCQNITVTTTTANPLSYALKRCPSAVTYGTNGWLAPCTLLKNNNPDTPSASPISASSCPAFKSYKDTDTITYLVAEGRFYRHETKFNYNLYLGSLY